MGYLYLIVVTVIFSFGGILIKSSALMFNADVISFLRFALGVVILVLLVRLQKHKMKLVFFNQIVWLGAICKSVHYIGENIGVSQGFSFGNIVVWPVQTVAVLLFSLLFLKEKVRAKSIVGTLLCVMGIVIISWNGVSMESFLRGNIKLLLCFVIAGIGSAGFTISQKLLLDKMSTTDMNLSMFMIACGICAVPLPFRGEITLEWRWEAIVSILILGVITGIGFLMIAEAMKTIPLFMVTVIQSTTVIFSLLWAVLFFKEPVTVFIMVGTSIFVVGMLLINVKKKQIQGE